MNLLTKFHEDRTINVASRKNAPPLGIHVFQANVTISNSSKFERFGRKNAPPLGSHVFQANVTIFELIQDIIQTNLLTKFHEDWTINVASKTSRPLFHDDWAKIVTSRVFTRNTAPPPGGYVFQRTGTIFELNPTYHLDKHFDQSINGTNVLTKFHEDQTIMWPLECSQAKMLTTDDAQQTKGITKALHEHVVLR
ncbi:hypothetical protein DPMN_193424 [Dreissena polymorpha]|uniref:Uncharacterized protein n=1 Tax=Dreissena polymorpha TaxID=45954 RepID=A0A9D3Y1A3_DREPO|nr:hypothetical protein DPMN_193424 [Dreissena polymorpha]